MKLDVSQSDELIKFTFTNDQLTTYQTTLHVSLLFHLLKGDELLRLAHTDEQTAPKETEARSTQAA